MESRHKQAYSGARTFFWFAASFLILFFASKSLGLTIGYSLDDYFTLAAGNSSLHSDFLSQGRFTFALLQTWMDFSDLKQSELAGLGFFLSAGGLLLISWLTLAKWLQEHHLLAAAVGALLGAHPFFTEYVSFRQSLFPMGICFTLLAGAIVLLMQGTSASMGRLFAAVTLAATASGINQIGMSFFCIAALSISLQKRGPLLSFRALLLAVKDTVIIGALASILYLAVVGITMHLIAFDPNARLSTLGFNQVSDRIHDVAILLMNVLGGNHPLVGSLASICITFAIITIAIRVSINSEQWTHALMGAVVLAVGIILALAPNTFSGVWWPVPRTLIALPLAIALAVVVLSFGARRGQIRAASGALFIAVVILAGKSGSLLMDQQRLNRWDMELAREIVFKIAENRQIDPSTPIVIHRAKWAHEIGEGMPIGDTNTSALKVNWAVDALFEEASGRKMQITQGSERDKICTNAPVFPTTGSILEVNGTIHVCL